MTSAENQAPAEEQTESAEHALVVARRDSLKPARETAVSDRPSPAWDLYRDLEFQAIVMVPLEDTLLGDVIEMGIGTVLRSAWPATSDVMLCIQEVQLGRVSLEPSESRLGFRLNSLSDVRSMKDVPVARDATAEKKRDAGTSVLQSIKMEAVLCFGAKRMTLEEVLGMTLGDLLPLDRDVDEEVTLLINRRPFAAGTLVLMNGCYALELTRILQANAPGSGTILMQPRPNGTGAQVMKADNLPSDF